MHTLFRIFAAVLLITLSFGTINANDVGETCYAKPDGIYPSRNCFEYTKCHNQSREVVRCPLENAFNAELKICVPKKELNEENYCKGRTTGDWMCPWNCHMFITCNAGWFKLNSCQKQFMYDPVTDTCLYSSQELLCQYTEIGSHLQQLKNAGNISTHQNFSASKNSSTDEVKQIPETAMLSYSPTSYENRSRQDLVTPGDLERMLNIGNITLIDVREPWELKKFGKIGLSYNIPLNDILQAFNLPDNEFKKKYQFNKPALGDCNLVFHCRSGFRSWHALQHAKSLGYTCAKSLDGGFMAWEQYH